jgi:flavin reductase (DIM6/NTAB) family NADH-FMN oxidoreductase RutF
VTVVTAVRPDGEPVGVTANSFASVSLDPPLLLWCLSAASASVSAFQPAAGFAVHVLAHSQIDIALHFARRGREKFDVDRHWRLKPHPPRIADALCRFDCHVHALQAAGDHWIVIGRVDALQTHAGRPLGFHAGRFGAFAPDPGYGKVDIWDQVQGEWF